MTGRPLRILQVMRAPVGGLFRHVIDLTEQLALRGHAVGIVVDTLANDARTEILLTALEAHASLGIHRFEMPRVFGAGDIKTPFAVSKLARKLDIDVMHGHGAKGGFYARLASYGKNRAKVFYTPHGGVLHYKADSSMGRLFHALERALMAKTSALIFESAYAEKTYEELIGAPTCPTRIIHNGIRPEEFEPIIPAADAAEFVFVGALRELKGIYPLVEALAGIPDVRLVMAGDGEERAALEARIAELGIGERVTLVGSQPARKVFAMGRCVVVPSLAESLPYIIMEAAAARRPVISTQVGGIGEIFGPTAGSLIAPNDPVALRAAMLGYLQHPGEVEAEMNVRLGHIKEAFSVARMVDEIEALYRSD